MQYRNLFAALVALATTVSLGLVFHLAGGSDFLMPGPLQSGHGTIDKCSTCHTKSGEGKLGWFHGLIAGDPLADSKACLACHKMPDTAFNAHGASTDVLRASTERLARLTAYSKDVPLLARAQTAAFPTRELVARGLYCATCHQEHQGAGSDLKSITDEQCRSCHVVKFDSFEGRHPEPKTYPFKRRTRIIFDHNRHFEKHYPEVAKREPAKRIPESCSSCHNSAGDRRIMSVAPFDKTCSTCHLSQITGEQRASGPKGVAFLSLPGIDLDTIRKRKGAIGEWPEGSEAQLTPFMKVMISRSERGRALIRIVDGLDLQDLSAASAGQVKAVIDLVWEIKALFAALISGKMLDVFGNLKLKPGTTFNPDVVSKLTASIPRDVLIASQQRYLPSLAREIAEGPSSGGRPRSTAQTASDEKSASTKSRPPIETVNQDASQKAAKLPAVPREPPGSPSRNPQACLARVLGQCLLFKSEQGDTAPLRLGGPRNAERDHQRVPVSPLALPGTTKLARARSQNGAADTPRKSSRTSKRDDLLFPTKSEQREINAHRKDAGRATKNDKAPSRSVPPSTAAPAVTIGNKVDPESWAKHGGWYLQDHEIYYRPAGHKDPFIYTWLTLTGSLSPAHAKTPPAAVFDALTGKDAQGACSKCHSIDNKGEGRQVNFSPLSVTSKQGRFTRFIHEPHFGVVGNSGCLTCHKLENKRPYLKGYEQGNPLAFSAEFGTVKINGCQKCHSGRKARQDCLLCHKYHVNTVVTPMSDSKLRPTRQF